MGDQLVPFRRHHYSKDIIYAHHTFYQRFPRREGFDVSQARQLANYGTAVIEHGDTQGASGHAAHKQAQN